MHTLLAIEKYMKKQNLPRNPSVKSGDVLLLLMSGFFLAFKDAFTPGVLATWKGKIEEKTNMSISLKSLLYCSAGSLILFHYFID